MDQLFQSYRQLKAEVASPVLFDYCDHVRQELGRTFGDVEHMLHLQQHGEHVSFDLGAIRFFLDRAWNMHEKILRTSSLSSVFERIHINEILHPATTKHSRETMEVTNAVSVGLNISHTEKHHSTERVILAAGTSLRFPLPPPNLHELLLTHEKGIVKILPENFPERGLLVFKDAPRYPRTLFSKWNLRQSMRIHSPDTEDPLAKQY